MRLFIPPLGTHLRLTAEWAFEIQYEHRNGTFFESDIFDFEKPDRLHYPNPDNTRWSEKFWNCTLPAGTVLALDRIYIRKGGEDFDSVTFFIKDCPDKRFLPKSKKGTFIGVPRFWVKLPYANLIECEIVE